MALPHSPAPCVLSHVPGRSPFFILHLDTYNKPLLLACAPHLLHEILFSEEPLQNKWDQVRVALPRTVQHRPPVLQINSQPRTADAVLGPCPPPDLCPHHLPQVPSPLVFLPTQGSKTSPPLALALIAVPRWLLTLRTCGRLRGASGLTTPRSGPHHSL